MSHTFEQFVRFTTDAGMEKPIHCHETLFPIPVYLLARSGLERTFRLLQSITQVLSSYTLPFECLLFLIAYLPLSTSKAGPDAATTHAVLVGLRGQLALARRYFRLFRFLESFHAAQKLYLSLSSTTPSASRWGNADVWIDVFGRSFNGMYLLLEASTIADAQKIDGLALWGPELEAAVGVEGQRFWLFSLACGALSGLVKIANVVASASAPASGKGRVSAGTSDGDVNEKKEGSTTEGDGQDEKTSDEEEKQQSDQIARSQEVRSKIVYLGRRVVSDTLDITIPGSIVGWVPVSTGTVGLAMFVTTVLTSIDIWERCGREVANSKK
ncbi:peroxisomal biogenesis factor 11-domain-containing protein [Xylaria digitata]|nr:peroxisomal biogenesis factor 11-domain-containing protein [Xylaria digitata]